MTADRHPSRLELDVLVYQPELALASDTKLHVAGCARCRSRLEQAAGSDAAFREKYPSLASLGAPGVRARVDNAVTKPVVSRNIFRRALPLALAAGLALLAGRVLLPQSETRSDTRSDTRVKGSSIVELFVRRGEGEARGYSGEPLHAGDTLVFGYSSTHRHLLVLNIEAPGRCSVVIDGAIEPGQNRVAPLGVKLDAHPGPERYVALLSEAPLDPERVLRELKERAKSIDPKTLEVGRLDLDADQHSWLIHKEAE
jgi:hypothetical protein